MCCSSCWDGGRRAGRAQETLDVCVCARVCLDVCVCAHIYALSNQFLILISFYANGYRVPDDSPVEISGKICCHKDKIRKNAH